MPTAAPPPDAPRPLGVGDPAPDFALPAAPGRASRLSGLRGSPVVLAFPGRGGAAWDPARAEYVDAYHRLAARIPGGAAARLLRVGGGDTWRELTFAEDGPAGDGGADGGAIPLVAEDDAAVARLYGVAGGPAVFVLDEAGTVRWRSPDGTGPAGALPHPDEVAAALAALAPAAHDRLAVRPGAAGPEGAAWSRRAFVAAVFGASLALVLAPGGARAAGVAADGGAPSDAPGAPNGPADRAVGAAVPVTLRVNGRDLALELEPRVTLLDALREYAGLTGTKKGCAHGQCGACTVHVDGRRVLSCLTLAVMAQGKAVTTIEGLAGSAGLAGDALHPVQAAFVRHDGFQCGYCTPGQIMSAAAVLHEPWGPADDDVREAMSGNLCRCGAYPGIVAAVQEARGHPTAVRAAAGEA